MKMFRNEAGQTLVFTAFLMCCLMGFMAMAIDVGVLLRAQRRVQTAADAAAIAAGLEYYYHGSGNATTVAQTAAANNGVTVANQVTVNIPPVGGWHTAQGYLEVVITQPNPTFFMAAFGGLFPGGSSSSFGSVGVTARAVVGIVPGQSCVYILDQKNSGSLSVKGGSTVNSANCSWTVDSSSPSALCITGQNANANLNVPAILLVNAQQTNKNCNKLFPGASTTGTTSPNPLANTFSFPDPTKVCDAGNTVTQATVSALPSGIKYESKNTGGYSTTANPLSYDVLCFNAGAGVPTQISGTWTSTANSNSNTLFLFENGVALTGATTFNGTVDLNNGIFCQGGVKNNSTCQSNSTIQNFTVTPSANGDNLIPPDNSVYAMNGMAIIMPPTNTAPTCDNSYSGPTVTSNGTPNACLQMQFGSNSGTFTGFIYAPSAALSMQDNGGSTLVAGLIVDALSSNSDLTITNYGYAHPDSPLNHVALVE